MDASQLEDVAAVIGYRAARILAVTYAGRYLHVPTTARDAHPLAALVGGSAVAALVREFGGSRLWVPTEEEDGRLRRDWRIAQLLAAGWPCGKIADHVGGITPRRVEQLRRELGDWIEYARGWAAARARRGAAPGAVDFSGTGETSDDTPTPGARPAAAARLTGSGGQVRRGKTATAGGARSAAR